MTRYFVLFLMSLSSIAAVAAPPDPMQYGRAYLAEGENIAAVKSYAEALRLNPFDPVALNNMGVAKAAIGDYQAAIDFFTRAGNLAPNRMDIKENIANLQGWAKTYTGVTPVSAARPAIFIAEPPALWSALPNDAAKVDRSRQLNPVCNNNLCK